MKDDGSKLNTKEVQVGEAKIKIVRRLEKKDYLIKGIESSNRAERFKVEFDKDGNEINKEFVEFVK